MLLLIINFAAEETSSEEEKEPGADSEGSVEEIENGSGEDIAAGSGEEMAATCMCLDVYLSFNYYYNGIHTLCRCVLFAFA